MNRIALRFFISDLMGDGVALLLCIGVVKPLICSLNTLSLYGLCLLSAEKVHFDLLGGAGEWIQAQPPAPAPNSSPAEV